MTKKKSIVILSFISILIILGTVFAFVSLNDGQLGVYNYNAYPGQISLGLDLSGGVYAVYDVDTEDENYINMTASERTAAIEGTRTSLERLLFDKGYPEAVVSVYDTSIRVEVPDVDDPERLFSLIGRPSKLEFKEYNSTDNGASNETLMTGDEISATGVQYDSSTGYYVVALEFTRTGATRFAEITGNLTGKQLAIFINSEFVIAPSVSSSITGGSASISGNYSYDDAYNLAVQIQAGSFPLVLNMVESSTVTASLGSSAIQAGVIAGLVGLAIIVIYLILLYRLMGVAAGIALIFYTMTYIFFLSIFPWVQLTLSGIAGILLSIGMAVDANVIIFERIKEEYSTGKSMRSSVDIGFKRSMGAIIDGNITTLMGALVMFLVGTSSIQSFGITLFIGIVLSLISSIIITRIILKCIMVFHKESQAVLYNLKRAEAEDEEEVVAEKELAKEGV